MSYRRFEALINSLAKQIHADHDAGGFSDIFYSSIRSRTDFSDFSARPVYSLLPPSLPPLTKLEALSQTGMFYPITESLIGLV